MRQFVFFICLLIFNTTFSQEKGDSLKLQKIEDSKELL